VVAYKRFNHSYAFYLGTPIEKIHDPEELDSLLISRPKTRVITTKKHLKELEGIEGLAVIYEQKDLFENPTTVVLSFGKD
jgi:hypothetical protein